ncbi:MAG: aldehyde dehydrogenase family protein [Vampirovibrio sp.]|nr:aldehyde dehydrogenase family protein [Vampirovibrio sp.]
MTVEAKPNAHIQTVSPKTGEMLAEYPVADEPAVQTCVSQSHQVFEVWRKTTPAFRAKILRDIAKSIYEHREALANMIHAETGKPMAEIYQSDLVVGCGVFRYYAKKGPAALKERIFLGTESLMMGRYHKRRFVPRGVVGIISPWNYPLAIPASGIAAALMGGNTVVLKPSELTPGTAQQLVTLIRSVLKQSGIPQDVVQIVVGEGSTGKALSEADIDYAIFTGSAKVGRQVQATLQAKGKEVSLELGGSDPMIVLESAKDLDATASFAVWGRCVNAGQACAAVKRLIVPAAKYDEVVTLVAGKMKDLANSSAMGPVVSQRQRDGIVEQVRRSKEAGGQIEAGRDTIEKFGEKPGWWVSPTVLKDTPNDAPVICEEVFGPVLPVIPYTTVEEAIAMANDTGYGLTASVFGEPTEAEEVAKQLQAGMVGVNETGATNYAVLDVPWSGWKNSGPGVSHGVEGLLATTLRQTLTVNVMDRLPGFSKMPWHFSKNPGLDLPLAKQLFEAFGRGSLWAKLDPRLAWRLWQHRASRKL